MANPFLGRRESIGFGKESTPGTAVAPTQWQRQLKLTLDQKTTQAQNKSAMGRVEDINDSAVTEEWAEGSINGKVTDIEHGLFLLNIFGTVTTALHSSETIVYDNTFTVNQTTLPPTLTAARTSPVVSRRYALCTLTDYELDITMGDWAQFTASLLAKTGASSSETVSLNTSSNEFTSKHATVKIASATGGLSAATALQLKSLKLKITRKADRFTPFGTIDPTAFDLNSFGVTGELVLRYTDTTLEALALANTRQAMSIALVNTDVTIGSATNPSLTFTMPKVRLTPITLDNNLDQPLSQTVAFTAELDTTAGNMIQAVLTNITNGY